MVSSLGAGQWSLIPKTCLRVYLGYIGIMEKKMETTICIYIYISLSLSLINGLGFRTFSKLGVPLKRGYRGHIKVYIYNVRLYKVEFDA